MQSSSLRRHHASGAQQRTQPAAWRSCAARHPFRALSARTSGRKAPITGAGPSDVFVLDFDGVLVDSEPEVSTSAYTAAKDFWPQQFAHVDSSQQGVIMDGLRRSRPVLVSGYESMVMARMLLEDPGCWNAILHKWPQLMHQTLARWGEQEDRLQQAFETHRAGWLANDRQGWLSRNKPYPGIRDALQHCDAPFYIASSKAGHRVAVLLQEQLGQDIAADSPRLYAALLPPEERKVAALRDISERPVCSETGARLHFVDDRLDTLLAVRQAVDLRDWNLYLADWGYNTEEERAAAAATPGIRLLGLKDFIELLKWGLLMSVDDGCEPTAEEVAASTPGVEYKRA